MKISDFAKEFGVKKSTIRYYTDEKLLYPKLTKQGYDYGDKCNEDMKNILEYKDLGFSIEDTKQLVHYKRFVKIFVGDELDNVLGILDNQRNALNVELEQIKNKIQLIDIHKETLLSVGDKDCIGVPMKCIGMLACPICGKSIRLLNSEVTEHGVVNGVISCVECGNVGRIIDGIIDTRRSGDIIIPRSKNKDKVRKWQEIFEMMYRLDDIFKADEEFWKGDIFLFNGADTELLTISITEYMSDDKIYIFTEKSHSILKKVKQKLNASGVCGNVLFICLEDRVPLKPVADRVVDLFGINMNSLYPNEEVINLMAISKGIKEAFEYMGAYIIVEGDVGEVDDLYNISFFNRGKIEDVLSKVGIDRTCVMTVERDLPFAEYLPIAADADNNAFIEYMRGKSL